MPPFNRRQFLTASAAGAALAALPLNVRGENAPLQKVTVGVMGLGRGLHVARAFAQQPGVIIKYICDVDENRLSAARNNLEKEAEQHPEPISDFRRILDDQQVDALICAAPNHWHAPATILGCHAGKHVYVEKPCSHNPWEGETMVAVARQHKRVVQMGTQRRSAVAFQEGIQKLHEGIIGKVYESRAWYNNLRASIGKGNQTEPPATLDYELWQGPAPRVPYYDNRIPYNWHWFWNWGNGELGNNGVHTLDICRWGLGVDYPSFVVSSGGRYRYEDDQQTPDTHVATFEFPGGKQACWQGLSCNKHADTKSFVSFYGENGSCEFESSGKYRIFNANDKLIDEFKADAAKGGIGQLDQAHAANFVAAIRNQSPEKLNQEIEEGHKSTLLCHLGNISYRVGRTLKCDPAQGHILNDSEAMEYWKRQYAPGWEPKV
jgi:predicted dehydrogenase